jgi:hypothetical protein
MAYKYPIFLAFLFICCQRNTVQFGEYDVTHNGINYSLELYKDSTFRYIKRYEWPIEVTLGIWHMEDKRLILNSLPNTDTLRKEGFTSGKYIIIKNKSLLVRRNRIISEDSPVMRYKFYKTKK